MFVDFRCLQCWRFTRGEMDLAASNQPVLEEGVLRLGRSPAAQIAPLGRSTHVDFSNPLGVPPLIAWHKLSYVTSASWALTLNALTSEVSMSENSPAGNRRRNESFGSAIRSASSLFASLDAMSKPDRVVRGSRLLALIFVLLGGLGLAASNVAYPYRTTVMISDLTREADGALVGDFSMPWPFRINKRALDRMVVTLPDGAELARYPKRSDLVYKPTGTGFYFDRPEIVFRLDGAAQADPDATVTVTLPTKARDSLYQVPFGLAALVILVSWLGARLRAIPKALRWRHLAVAAGSLAVMLAGLVGLIVFVAKGPALWLALMALLLGPLIAAATLFQVEAVATGRPSRSRERLIKLALLIGSVLVSCMVFEAYFAWQSADFDVRKPSFAKTSSAKARKDWFMLPTKIVRLARSRARAQALPDAWRRRDEAIKGASSAYTWHGALHIRDVSGFRRLNGPFPAKESDMFRIMVVGDSLTYGDGIEEEWTFSRLLERSLQDGHRVEVVNLGRTGYESEDVLQALYKFVPLLDPDLVVYAVSLTDFQPAARGEHATHAFPILERWKQIALERTHLARLVAGAFRKLLLALDLRADYYDEILAGGKGYQTRFARDVSAMNRFVQKAGLPVTMGIVFHMTDRDPRARDLVKIAESALWDADFDVISVVDKRKRFRGRFFRVSRWEPHPNELAHSLVAKRLYDQILTKGYLDGFRKLSN